MNGNSSTSKISFINSVVLASLKTSSEAVIVKNFVKAAIEILRADYGFSFIKDGKSGEFNLLYKDKNTPYDPQVPRKTGITYRAFKSHQPQYFSIAGNVASLRSDAKQNMKGVVVIPITYKHNNYGTLDICFFNKHHFTETEKNLCTYIGNSTAQAITINRFHANLEDLVAKRTAQLKQSRDSLERDKAEDEALLSSLGEGIIATDTEGKIILFNPQAEDILKTDKEKMLGRNLYDALPLYHENGDMVTVHERPLHLALIHRKKIKTKNYNILRIDGRKIPVSITVTPIKLKDRLIGAIEVIHDIIKEKEIDRAKSELISLASHQLRTPLSAINWYTESLIKKELGPVNSKQKKYLQEIFNANQKMIELVYDFLNVSRIELGTFVIQLSTFSPKEIIRGILRELKPQISKKRLKVTESYGPGLDHIQADKKIVRLIFQNLLSNAVKYTPDRGNIELKTGLTTHSKPQMAIEITDTGYGIPKHQHDKIFTKLFRADNISRMQTEGTGLGLYIVKSFVDLCGGKIRFRSKENVGTKFLIELPVRKAPAGVKA